MSDTAPNPTSPNLIRLVEPEMTGGKISKSTIDTLQSTDKTELKISGLRQDTLEYLVSRYGNQFTKIEFFKCPRVQDLSCLEELSNVQQISWFWNQQATQLWDLSKNGRLTMLDLNDFKKVENIDGLVRSKTLQHLELDVGIWGKWAIDSLDVLTHIDTLEVLYFNTRPKDGCIAPIARIKRLKELGFANKIFTTEQIAWLTARLSGQVQSDNLSAYIKYDDWGMGNNILIAGRRKPFLNEEKDAEKLVKYVAKFDVLVQKYTNNPELPEPVKRG